MQHQPSRTGSRIVHDSASSVRKRVEKKPTSTGNSHIQPPRLLYNALHHSFNLFLNCDIHLPKPNHVSTMLLCDQVMCGSRTLTSVRFITRSAGGTKISAEHKGGAFTSKTQGNGSANA